MVWHNISQLQNVSTVVDVTDYISTSTNGIFFGALLIIIFVIILMTMLKYNLNIALLTSGFLSFILSLYLVYLNYVNFTYTIIFAGIIIFSGLALYMKAD